MKALVAARLGMPPEMMVQDRPMPRIQPNQSLVRMHAATINPLSSYVRQGEIATATSPLVLSNDGAGTIEQSSRFTPGTRVAIYGGGELGITEDGLQQQWVVVDDKRLIVLPATLSLDEGAALPINYVTAHQAITRVGKLKRGQTVLIPGATGALGYALVQTATALGATVIAVVSNANKAAHARSLGLSSVIDLSQCELIETVMSRTDGQGVDLAFDPVGGAMLGLLVRALRQRGAVVSIGFAGGGRAEFDVIDLVVHEKRILGYDAHLESEADADHALTEVQRLAEAGYLRPVIDSTYTFDNFEDGYRRLASRQAMGALLLRVDTKS
ncbi:quinone oxidoreductase family protein [Paraburkholderia bannensis]|uniref:quinone oxidoreductase family protein n=1 Tax=Paraburkholderia bannensis TaxID=765414 RepID=UPI002AB65A36|nr:zinc-binding alcohol dehydrogenase family protein [Paraburkholderia bannensis]